MTIPTMKRTGFSPSYSGAIEACTCTGGTTYSEVALAAIIPAFLFYMRALSLDQLIGASEK